MDKKILSIVVCTLLIAVALSMAGSSSKNDFTVDVKSDGHWVSINEGDVGAQPKITVLESNQKKTVFEVDLQGFWALDRNIGGYNFKELKIPGHTTTMEVGKPSIPVLHVIIAIPNDANVDASYESLGSVVLKEYKIIPFQKPTTDEIKDTNEFSIDKNAYQSSEAYPPNCVDVSTPAIWRDIRIVTVEIRPLEYIPSQDVLKVKPHMVIELDYSPGSTINVLENNLNTVDPDWARMYKQYIINYDWLDMNNRGGETNGPAYLIITHPNFENAIQPLADWHNKEGLKTEVLSISTTSAQTIKNEIIARYNMGNLKYVLLVGDTNYMPVYYWSGEYDNYLSDYWYACITGSPDVYADIAVGRLSVTNNYQAQNQVSKILTYEKNPPLDNWLNKILLVAHRQDAPGKYVECKEYIHNYIIPQPPFTVDTAYGHLPSGTNANVATAINNGRNVVNYRGHGGTTEWWEWSYYYEDWSTSNVNSLSNGDRTPVVFNIACDNHQIQYSCLGESWLNKYPGGAVASLGASDPSFTYANHDYDKELFRQFCQNGEYHLGMISNAGATYIINHHGDLGKDNAKMYLWLGDPALQIWTDIPESLTVTHPGQIFTGLQNLEISVTNDGTPVSDATVCLYKDGEVYEVSTTGGNGAASFSITTATAGTLEVTVTKHNYLPYEGEIEVISDGLSASSNGLSASNGGSIDFTLNAGVANAGRTYLILGSVSGTSPGTPLPGGLVTLPLNWDSFTNIVWSNINTPMFTNFMGTLDGNGQATAQLNIGPVSSGYVGTKIYFAYTCNNPFDYVSNPIEIEIME